MKYFSIIILLIFYNQAFAQTENLKIRISPLTENFYIHTSYNVLGNDTFPSNGLFVVTENSILLFDTPWNEAQTNELIDSCNNIFHKKINFCIVTHFHDDRTAGLNILKKNYIPTYSSQATKLLCIQNNEKFAESVFLRDTTFLIDNIRFQTYFPGEGHTRDNIVVWFPDSKILYGGCLIKSIDSKSLGNTKDANIKNWSNSVKSIINKYKEINFVIPGHYNWGDSSLLNHTIDLTKQDIDQ